MPAALNAPSNVYVHIFPSSKEPCDSEKEREAAVAAFLARKRKEAERKLLLQQKFATPSSSPAPSSDDPTKAAAPAPSSAKKLSAAAASSMLSAADEMEDLPRAPRLRAGPSVGDEQDRRRMRRTHDLLRMTFGAASSSAAPPFPPPASATATAEEEKRRRELLRSALVKRVAYSGDFNHEDLTSVPMAPEASERASGVFLMFLLISCDSFPKDFGLFVSLR